MSGGISAGDSEQSKHIINNGEFKSCSEGFSILTELTVLYRCGNKVFFGVFVFCFAFNTQLQQQLQVQGVPGIVKIVKLSCLNGAAFHTMKSYF